jgi:23S rRNA (pseudouridine1915-N3)-methyltransferase
LIVVLAIENHKDEHVDALCNKYQQRMTGPYKMQVELLPAARVKDPQMQKEKETAAILKALKSGDTLILCDEHGKKFNSISFSEFVSKQLSQSRGRIVFAIGGAYGFTPEILEKYTTIKLTDFTLPHHLARLILVEQLYRASEITKGTGYHHI